MRLPSYSDYKHSGVDWLGAVPAHWSTRPLWTLFRRAKRTGFADETLLSVYREYGVIPKSSRDDNFNKPSDDLSGYQLVEPEDLAINKMKAWQGSVGISGYRGIVSPAYHVYAKHHGFNSRFLHHLFRCSEYISGYQSNSKGIRINQWDLEPDQHSRMPVLLPPTGEQKQIANFLDHETARIDALIEEQQRLIDLLQEKRQAVISHAVTKGLDPDVPMKDSGVQWLGAIPTHWSIGRVKNVTSFITSGPRGWSEFVDENGADVFLQSGDLDDSLGVNFSDANRINIPEGSEGVRTQIQEGDVVVCITGANTARVAIVRSLSSVAYVNQHLALIRPHNTFCQNFLGLSLAGNGCQSYFHVEQYGLKQGLSLTDIADAPIALPPVDEQEDIAKQVTEMLQRLDGLAFNAGDMVELLRERRSALVSAAVTGKIDVRDWKPQNAPVENDLPMVAEPEQPYG